MYYRKPRQIIFEREDYKLILTYGRCYNLVESPVERLFSDSSVAVALVSVVVEVVVVVTGSEVCTGGQQNFTDPLPLLLGRGAGPREGRVC